MFYNKHLLGSIQPGKSNPEDEAGNGAEAGVQPPTKRLRLRGDWSDTGPNARPERERTDDQGKAKKKKIVLGASCTYFSLNNNNSGCN